MEQRDEVFSYTYSAEQHEEVQRIRKKYAPPAENRLEQLRRLDEQVDRPGVIASLALGIMGTLAFGLGLCCATVWMDYFALGVVAGLIGLVGIGAAYPLYRAITKRRREKVAPEIMRLSAELLE